MQLGSLSMINTLITWVLNRIVRAILGQFSVQNLGNHSLSYTEFLMQWLNLITPLPIAILILTTLPDCNQPCVLSGVSIHLCFKYSKLLGRTRAVFKSNNLNNLGVYFVRIHNSRFHLLAWRLRLQCG